MFVANRVLSTHQDLYENKVRKVNAATVSSGMSSAPLIILARELSGTPSFFTSCQTSLVFYGGGLTPTEIEDLTDAFEAYMDANGKGVIP
jgi:hypothetical protein